MSRHRNIRSMNYSDEYDGYDDVYGHSVEDDYCISPSDAAFIYDREGSRGQQKISAFFKSDDDIAEEDETADKVANLDDIEKAKLNSSIEKVKSVLGDIKISEQDLIYLILKHNFDVEKVIDVILSSNRLFQQEIKTEAVKEKDLTKNNNQGKISIPKLFGDTNSLNTDNFFKTSVGNHKKFDVPSLFSSNSDTTDSSKMFNISDKKSSHSSLSSLVSNHLRISDKPTDTPELFNNLTDSSSHSSLSSLVSSHLKITGNIQTPKLNELENKTDFANNEWHIDLTSALCNSNSTQLDLSKNRIVDNEVFLPQFVDCSAPKPNKIFNDFCKIDISDILLINNILETDVSEFGKIVTRSFRLHAPNFHFYEKKYASKFDFNIPSPDDAILKHLRRK